MPALFENLTAFIMPLVAWVAASDPVGMLYSLLAGTYGGAACAAAANDHRALCRCYVLSAALHGLISMCHHLHI